MTDLEKLATTFIALLVITVLVIVIVMWGVSMLEEPPAQDPPTETVPTDTQVKAGQPVSSEAPVALFDEVAKVDNYEAAGTDEAQIAFHFIDCIDTYLAWPPPSYEHLVDSGRRLDMIARGIPAIVYECTDAYKQAALIAFHARCFETFIGYFAPTSPWTGRGIEVVMKCWAAGIDWEMCAATLYAESDWGRQTTGLIFGNAYTLDGWIAWCLKEMADPNDVDNFVNEFHMPANIETYRFNFGRVVEMARGWRI